MPSSLRFGLTVGWLFASACFHPNYERPACGPNGECPDGFVCVMDGTFGLCGNGVVDVDEVCDDGNMSSGDGCSSFCRIEHCGNNVIDLGEQCDGSPVGGFACKNCHLVKCGDAIVDTTHGEECDDGNNSANDDCISNNANPAACRIATCGDRIVNANREQCDHGPTNGLLTDTCSAICNTVACGNGFLEQGEDCDDSNHVNTDGCTNACDYARCGDRIIETGVELCDDGNTVSGDGCSSTCQTET
jgi:cysteine-rich repeat protein